MAEQGAAAPEGNRETEEAKKRTHKEKPMKTPLEMDEKTSSLEADFLRSQYFQMNDRPVIKSNGKKDDLLTPFLLSIPVILMLIILIYSL